MDKARGEDSRMRRIHKVGAVILKDRKLLVVKKNTGDIFISPGGKRRKNETPEETLRRELKEELDVELVSMRPFGVFKDKAIYEKNTQLIMDTYFVRIKGEAKPRSEIERIVWIDRNYEQQRVEVAPILEKFIIPRLIKMGLL
jgi:8-oxo-dGTP diphosphatase